jgi:phage tail sheath gpL-like
MAIQFSDIPLTIRVPGTYAEIDTSLAAGFASSNRVLLLGQKLPSGTQAANSLVQIESYTQARTLFGHGSYMSRIVKAFLDQTRLADVWAIPQDDNAGGVAATGQITIGGGATAAGTLHLMIAGQDLKIVVANTDTPTIIGGYIQSALGVNEAGAVTLQSEYPVIASSAAGIVTITARHRGLLGNYIDIRANPRGAPGGEELPAGVTCAITPMSGGTLAPVLTNTIATMGDLPFDYVASPYCDAISLAALKTEFGDITGRWSPTRLLYGQVFTGAVDTYANLYALKIATTQNDGRMSVLGLEGNTAGSACPTPPHEVAGAYTGIASAVLSVDPARSPLGRTIQGISIPCPDATRFTFSQRNVLLGSGVATVHYPTVGSASSTVIERTKTTWVSDASLSEVNTLSSLAYYMRSLIALCQAKLIGKKLGDDPVLAGPGAGIVTPLTVRSLILGHYQEMCVEAPVICHSPEDFALDLVVERNATDRNRVDALVVPRLLTPLYVLAFKVQFVF